LVLIGCARVVDPPAVDTSVDPADPPTDPLDTHGSTDLPLPTEWGAGFVDLAPDWSAIGGFPVYPGRQDRGSSPQRTLSLIVDLDGDGQAEWMTASYLQFGVDEGTAALAVWRVDWARGGLTRAPDLEAPILAAGVLAPAGALDIDGDGRVDLLENLLPVGVLFADGDGYVRPAVDAVAGAGRPANAVTPMDLDHDGLLDLLVGQPRCEGKTLDVLLATAPRRFLSLQDRVAGAIGEAIVDAILPMPASAGGPAGVYPISLACDQAAPFPGFYELEGSEGLPSLRPVDPLPAEPFWDDQPTGQGAKISQVAPMGASLEDLDNDGVPELFITIGGGETGVFQRDGAGVWQDRTLEVGLFGPRVDGSRWLPWSVVHPDLDLNGRADVVVSYGDDTQSFFLARGFAMGTKAYVNAGAMRLVDVSAQVGLPVDGSWHGAVLSDPDCDGDADLALGGFGAPPRLFRNDVDVGRSALSLSLRGTTSDPLGIGAVVEVDVDGLPTRTMIVGAVGNPESLVAPELFVGLGEASVAREVRVRWPSGTFQVLSDVAGGRCFKVVEPEVVAVSARRAPVGAAVALTVTPRSPDGALRAGVAVSVRAEGAPATVVEGEAGRFTVTGPAAPGWTALVVTVDGVELATRPRVWWE
jgi:hypothetical protein